MSGKHIKISANALAWPLALLLAATTGQAQMMPEAGDWDEATALQHSGAAIGRQMDNHALTGPNGEQFNLADFAGKPLLISLVFTSCHHVCPVTTKRLAEAVKLARDALGDDSFTVLTIGFDTAHDTPQAMLDFARAQAVRDPNWHFLSASPAVIAELTAELGFLYYPSPRGFDHITQVTVIDRQGVVYRQVYGAQFELPWLVEPLKELVFNRPTSAGDPIASLLDRIRLFCTVFDPSSGHYRFDYSLFIQMAIGLLALLGGAFFLFHASRRAR